MAYCRRDHAFCMSDGIRGEERRVTAQVPGAYSEGLDPNCLAKQTLPGSLGCMDPSTRWTVLVCLCVCDSACILLVVVWMGMPILVLCCCIVKLSRSMCALRWEHLKLCILVTVGCLSQFVYLLLREFLSLCIHDIVCMVACVIFFSTFISLCMY